MMNIKHRVQRMRLRKMKCVVILIFGVVLYYICNYFGVGDYLLAKNFDKDFKYSLNMDVRAIAEQILDGETVNVEPINHYPHSFLTTSKKCDSLERVDLVILVKSAMDHYHHRNAIRQTFGQENYPPGTLIRTLFFVGVDGLPASDVQHKIGLENRHYKDIIQMDFIDSYYTNTNKTMMEFRWAFENCDCADYYLFTDDDMYVSVANLLDYARYGDSQNKSISDVTVKNKAYNKTDKPTNTNTSDKNKILIAGYLFNTAPLRMKLSKWVVSLEEYPYNKWPPYVTAGAYIVSNRALKLIYVGSQYVEHFKFDDVYLGILAWKMNIKLTHCPRFYYYKKKYTKAGYKDVIASHGYGDQLELVSVWQEQHSVYF